MLQVLQEPVLQCYMMLLWILLKVSNVLCGDINSLGPSDAICQQRSESPFAQVMACCLTAPSHYQAITWTNVDLSSVRLSDIHLRASSQEIRQPSITEIIWIITYLKCHSNFPRGQWVKNYWKTLMTLVFGWIIVERFQSADKILSYQVWFYLTLLNW